MKRAAEELDPRSFGPRSLARCEGGAVYVEFLGTFFIMFCFFLMVWQYSYLQTASIVVKHAAVQTARAAIVVLHDDPAKYDGVPVGQYEGKRKEEILRAANMVLKPLRGTPDDLRLRDMKVSYGRDDLIEIKLEFDYSCRIPFGRYILCTDAPLDQGYGPRWAWASGLVSKTVLSGYAALPNQGAEFEY